MTTLADLTAYNDNLYNNDMYDGDATKDVLLPLLARAATLTPRAQAEFVTVFNYEYALDGQVLIPARKRALYPALVAGAAAAGIEIVER